LYARLVEELALKLGQYAGFATAQESNQRYHELIEAGTTGLSVAFDLPTQMGYDSDAQVARGEVGKVGVPIDTVDDMRTLFSGIPLADVSTSMTINAPAAVLLLMYQTVGEEQGVPPDKLTGTIQNDVLKEYIARGTYIYPPRPSLRLVADTFAYCRHELPKWNTISISGYHMAEAGATPVQEIAFTLANAKEYVRAALASGLAVDDFAPRLSFFFVARTTLLEEVAKFRAARRLWARIMKEEFKAADPKSQMLRFHTQTAGVQLTAQQPEVNLIRVSLQALGAVLGGTQSLHTNSFDEALALPSTKAARLAVRTQQVIANESDLTATADPFAGSYAIESMTDDIEAAAESLIDRIEDMGGAAAAIEQGFQKAEIEAAAYQVAREIDEGERIVVGVNKFVTDGEEPYQPLRQDPSLEAAQAARLARLRQERAKEPVARAISALKTAAEGSENVLYPLRDALRADATLGEVCDALRDVWGEYRPREI
jgi:methylmalonyl-CoA mutase N-terminal domain/subunit